jgi:D-glycero-alpha-D-manno-heptose-7-phosphate kinase
VNDRSLPVFATAPLRISFVGGGTDFPHWFDEHGGAVLSSTIDHFVRVTITPRSDRQVRVRSLDLGHLVEYHLDSGPEYDGVMDLVKAAIARVGAPVGIDVDVESEAPAGSGLGGSSTLVTAVVAGLAMLGEQRMTTDELATLSYTIERDDLGISGGWQDQYAAAYGGFNLLEFSRGGVLVTPVDLEPARLAELASNLLLCYSGGVRRNVGLIDRQIELHRQGREDTLLGMKELQAMAYAMAEAAGRGDLNRLGSMLREAFEAKKRMNPHVTDDTPIEAMLDAARASGALGGKICGAGGGGYLLVFCPAGRQAEVRATLERLGGQFARFSFYPEGVRARRGDRTWAPAPG